MSGQGRENREYERYNATLEVQVSSLDSKGEQFAEAAKLRNISGGGANLVAGSPQHYFVGQKIDFVIHLPHAEELHTNMKGHGMVVWVDEEDASDGGGTKVSIGLCLDDLMAFDHLIGGN